MSELIRQSRLERKSEGAARIPPLRPSSLLEITFGDSLAHAIVATVREPLIVLDRSLRVVAASRSFYQLFNLEPAGTQGRLYYELGSGQWDIAPLWKLMQDVIAGGMVVEAYAIDLDVPGLGRRHILLNIRQVLDKQSPDTAFLVGLEDITARREAEDLKDTLLQRQEMLLLEVQHRVANSLQIIASILLLKARTVQSEETRLHLRDVRHRVISVATVQRQLCMSGLVNELELGPYLSTLCEGLASSMITEDRAVTITASSTSGTVRSDDAVSFGLIVTELVINALKHGFPHGRTGHIAVDFTADAQDWRLSVSDDGIGRAENPAEPSHVGLGTSIVEALARQLKATVEISARQPGTATAIVHKA